MADNEQPDSAAYAAALNDLAQLKLSEGKTEEAQELFRQALDVQQKLGAVAVGGDPGQHLVLEDWEAAAEDDSWEARLTARTSDGGGSLAGQSPQGAARQRMPRPGTASACDDVSTASRRAAPRQAAAATSAATPSSRSQHSGIAGDEVPFGGAHILELYDLTTTVRTTQLEQFLARLHPNSEVPPVLKWVDDYRALALFANPREAVAALQAAAGLQPAPGQPAYSLRTFADASALSRATPAAELKAPKPRPLTTATVARRLIGSALNVKLQDREEERTIQAARRQLKQAEAQRRERLDEAWGDDD